MPDWLYEPQILSELKGGRSSFLLPLPLQMREIKEHIPKKKHTEEVKTSPVGATVGGH